MAADLIRVTINLTGTATAALGRLVDMTGDSKTDVINRALRVYEWYAEAAGGTGRLRYVRTDGEQETVVFL